MECVIEDFQLHIYHEDNCQKAIVWIMGKHERDVLKYISERVKCLLIAIEIENWNDELSPWYVPAVFKGNDFQGNGYMTYQKIVKDIMPYLQRQYHFQEAYIAGYSMAGLFSLYVFHQCDIFAGVASCSGSLWYPGFDEFVKLHPSVKRKIYLSLGDKEHCTRNQLMAMVKEKTERLYEVYQRDNICVFEMNEGNHFLHVEKRLLDGMLWLIEGEK